MSRPNVVTFDESFMAYFDSIDISNGVPFASQKHAKLNTRFTGGGRPFSGATPLAEVSNTPKKMEFRSAMISPNGCER